MGPDVEYTTEKAADPIELRVYTGADGDFTLYADENVLRVRSLRNSGHKPFEVGQVPGLARQSPGNALAIHQACQLSVGRRVPETATLALQYQGPQDDPECLYLVRR